MLVNCGDIVVRGTIVIGSWRKGAAVFRRSEPDDVEEPDIIEEAEIVKEPDIIEEAEIVKEPEIVEEPWYLKDSRYISTMKILEDANSTLQYYLDEVNNIDPEYDSITAIQDEEIIKNFSETIQNVEALLSDIDQNADEVFDQIDEIKHVLLNDGNGARDEFNLAMERNIAKIERESA